MLCSVVFSRFNIIFNFQIVSDLTGAGGSSSAIADYSGMYSTINNEAEMV